MSWVLIVFAILLIGIGVDMLALSRNSLPLPQIETDKLIFGDPPRRVSDATRSYAESRLLVRAEASTRVLGLVLVISGLLSFAVGVGWLSSS